jgi:hypothetical protein
LSKEASEDFLLQMKELINKGQRHFVRRTIDGENYLQQLLRVGLTDIEEAWNCVLQLEKEHYCDGPDIDHRDGPGSPKVVWIFKMEINGILTYIKLKDEREDRGFIFP